MNGEPKKPINISPGNPPSKIVNPFKSGEIKPKKPKTSAEPAPNPVFKEGESHPDIPNNEAIISPATFSKYLQIFTLTLALAMTMNSKEISDKKLEPTKESIVDISAKEVEELIKSIESIKYSEHDVFNRLDRPVFCVFYNEFLKGKELNLQKLWRYLLDAKNSGKISIESLENYKKIIQEVIKIQKDFSKKGFFSKEGIASNFIPNTEKGITDAVSNFLIKDKKIQSTSTGFAQTFEVLNRNNGLVNEIEGLIKNLIEAMKKQVEYTLENGTPEEKTKAKEMAKVLIDTLKYFVKKK